MKIGGKEVKLVEEKTQVVLLVGDYIIAYINKEDNIMRVSRYWCDRVGVQLGLGKHFGDCKFSGKQGILYSLRNLFQGGKK